MAFMRATFVNRETTSKRIIQSVGLKMNKLSLLRNSHVLDTMYLHDYSVCGLNIWSR